MTLLYSKKLVSTFIIIVFTLLPFSLLSQETEHNKLWYNSVSIPPSPNSSAIGFFGEIPVAKSTGIPNINIPLFSLTEGGIEIPISLSYNASGVKVQQQETSVGLGWNLNAGGVITRTVNGRPDEDQFGFLRYGSKVPNVSSVLSSLTMPNNDKVILWLDMIARGDYDYEPDVFYYNFGNKSGYFMFGNHGLPILFPYSDIKIEPIWYGDSFSRGFKILDTDGKIYVFGDLGTQSNLYTETSRSDVDGKPQSIFTSTWQLNKIIDSRTQSEILLEYQDGYAGQDQVYNSSSCNYRQTVLNDETNYILESSTSSILTSNINEKIVKSIKSSLGVINFFYKNQTSRLDSIVFNSRKFIFKYSTFPRTPNLTFGNDPERLKLDTIIEVDKKSTDIREHIFEYEPGLLPSRHSFEVDEWGYYNGASGNTSFVPTTKVYGCLISNSNRKPNIAYSKIGILKKIIYPTGGWTQFDFESNKISRKQTKDEIEISDKVQFEVVGIGRGYGGSGGGGTYIIGPNSELDTSSFKDNELSNVALYSNEILPQEVCEEFTIALDNQYLYRYFKINAVVYSVDEYFSETNDYAKVKLEDPDGNIIFEDDFINSSMPVLDKFIYPDSINGCKLTICSSSGSCRAKVYISFIKHNPTQLDEEIEYAAGGLRIRQIVNFDPITNTNNYTTFEYTKGFYSSNNSSANISTNTVKYDQPWMNEGHFVPLYVNYLLISSSAGSSLGASSNVVSYEKVTEFKGLKDNNTGKIETIYPVLIDNNKLSPPYPFTISYQYLRNDPIKEVFYESLGNNQYRKTKEVKYNYVTDTNHTYSAISFKVTRVFDDKSQVPLLTKANHFVMDNYGYSSKTKKLDNVVTTEYRSMNDSITTDVKYFYENSNHSNATRTETKLSDGKILKTIYKYPLDYSTCKNVCQNDFSSANYNCQRTFTTCGRESDECIAIYRDCYIQWGAKMQDLVTTMLAKILKRHDYNQKYNKLEYMNAFDKAYYNRKFHQNNDELNSCLLSQGYYSKLQAVQCDLPICLENAYHAYKQCEIDYMTCLFNQYMEEESDYEKKAILLLALLNVNDKPVETSKYIEDKLVEHTMMKFNQIFIPTDSSYVPVPKEAAIKTNGQDFIPLMIYKNFDKNLNISEVASKVNSASKSYLWGYNNRYMIAEVNNATVKEIGYSGFEFNELNGWSKYPENTFDATTVYSGKSSMKVSTIYGPTAVFNVGSEASKHKGYQASVWVKGSQAAYLHIEIEGLWNTHQRVSNTQGTGWNLLKVELPSQIILSNPGKNVKVYVGTDSGIAYFDDFRFHPSDAQMTTYTYEPLVGVTSSSDPNSRTTTYEYDGFGRLKLVRDYLGNILKKHAYNYKTSL